MLPCFSVAFEFGLGETQQLDKGIDFCLLVILFQAHQILAEI